ncbi:hypothetical protein [Gimesia sp.]|uniref:hypothetical protein n=1 Tax=Gimesia sp. TaxID=2024833 RepID=UPI003A918095
MATQAYIDDGYSEEGFIKEVPGIHQACRFKYRPIMPGEYREALHHWSEISAAEKSTRINETIVKLLESWDLEFKSKILPIDVATLERLKQPFVDRLFNVVTGSDISDKDEQKKQVSKEKDAKN